MMQIDGIELVGNTASFNVVSSMDVRTDSWLLRQSVVTAKTLSGYKYSEVEMLSGKRVLVCPAAANLPVVPLNNNDVWADMVKLYQVISVSIQLSAADATDLHSLQTTYNACLDQYYVRRKQLLNMLGDASITYEARIDLVVELDNIENEGTFAVELPGLSLAHCRFAESGGLDIAYWTNGPYADFKATIVARTKIDL